MSGKSDFVVRYTNKDIMDKLEELNNQINAVHEQTLHTNGKVKLHTKLIWSSFGFSFTILLLLISYIK